MTLKVNNHNLTNVFGYTLYAVLCEFVVRTKKTFAVRGIVLLSMVFPFAGSGYVHAAAGDTITTTATVNYVIAGVPGSDVATASFIEDRKINFLVNQLNGGSAVPVISNMNNAVMQFSVMNSSNIVHDFILATLNTSPSPFATPVDNFDPLAGTLQTFVESGVTPGYQPAQDTAVFIDELAINASRIVYVLADMPAQATNDVAAMALVVQVAEGGAMGVEGAFINADDNSHVSPAGIFSNGATVMPAGIANFIPDSSLTMETVFNDPAGMSAEDISTNGAQDVSSNGQHSDAGAYQLMSPVNIVKTVTVIDTLGAFDPHPGATLRYQLAVTVAGNTAVDNLIISDLIPANTTYTDNSLLLNGVAQTDVVDAPTDYSRAIDILSKPVASIEVDLSQGNTVVIAPGITNIIIFEVTIN